MENCEIIEDFFGVYLLYSINPKFKGRTYIGYTRDPNRRIKQHNRGTWAGGAWKTSNRGPWKMILIVHGFPNNISALRFEWAWQNPTKTTRLQHISNLKRIPRKETEFRYKLRILIDMLNVGPWCRLPLVIQWLEKEFFHEFPVDKAPPSHIPLKHGLVKSKNKLKNTQNLTQEFITTECLLCSNYINDKQSQIHCLNTNCDLVCHLTCLADLFLVPGNYVPIEGNCPFCETYLKWGDLIKKMKGYSVGSVVVNDGDFSSDDDDVCSQEDGLVDNNDDWIDDIDD